MGLTQVAFAARLGVRQNTISQYESGVIAPSRSTLVHILPLADPDERDAIQRALAKAEMAELDAKFQTAYEETARVLDQELAEIQSSEKLKSVFNRFLREFVGRESVPLTVFEFLDVWLRFEGSVEFEKLATKAVRHLADEADRLERLHLIEKGLRENRKRVPKEKARQGLQKVEFDRTDPRYTGQELAVAMVCPHKGKSFYVGMRVTQAQFERSNFIQVPSRTCPHCLSSHIWSKKDVFLAMPANQ